MPGISKVDYDALSEKLLEEYTNHEKFRDLPWEDEGEERDKESSPQKECVKSLISGRDTIAIMPTASGKTLCYTLPAIYFARKENGLTIVVEPLVSLIDDQIERMRRQEASGASEYKTEIKSKCIKFNDETSEKETLADLEEEYENKELENRHIFLFVTPERLTIERFMKFAKKINISFIAIDEAHCITNWGYSFREKYLNIWRFVECLPKRPVIGAFSATMTPYMQQDIEGLLELKKPNLIRASLKRDNLIFESYPFDRRGEDNSRAAVYERKYARLKELLAAHKNENVIVYCNTVKTVDDIYERLQGDEHKVLRYHGTGKYGTEDAREDAKEFRADTSSVMIATKAFGMGIDIKNIRLVVHFDMPVDLESYIQETGRAGRDGKPSVCVLFHCSSDYAMSGSMAKEVSQILDISEEEKEFQKRLRKYKFDKMKKYAQNDDSSDERQTFMLRYMREELSDDLETLRKKIPLEKRAVPLYFNNSRAAMILRNQMEEQTDEEGEDNKQPGSGAGYRIGEEKVFKVGNRKRTYKDKAADKDETTGKKKSAPMNMTMTVTTQRDPDGGRVKPDYFDMLVMDCVYSLRFAGKTKVYPKNILDLLAGTEKVVMKKDKRKQIMESLELLSKTSVELYGTIDKKSRYFQGPLLDLKPVPDEGLINYYECSTDPVLAEVASVFGERGQFVRLDRRLREIKIPNDTGKRGEATKLQTTRENFCLQYYILTRIIQMHRIKTSAWIRMDTLIAVTGVNMPARSEEEARLKRVSGEYHRKWITLQEKIAKILDYYRETNTNADEPFISTYRARELTERGDGKGRVLERQDLKRAENSKMRWESIQIVFGEAQKPAEEKILFMKVGDAYALAKKPSKLATRIWEFQNPGRKISSEDKKSEYGAWKESVPVFLKYAHEAGLDDTYVIFELKTAIGDKRMDLVLLGNTPEGKPHILVVELKRWKDISDIPKYRGQESEHPLLQLKGYRINMLAHHYGLHMMGEPVKVDGIACLHNFKARSKHELFEGKYENWHGYEDLLFTRGKKETSRLKQFLAEGFRNAAVPRLLEAVEDNGAMLGEEGLAGLKRAYERMTAGAARLKADHKAITDYVIGRMKKQQKNPHRELIVISDAGGTGKTVLGIGLVLEYARIFNQGKNDNSAAFCLTDTDTKVVQEWIDDKCRPGGVDRSDEELLMKYCCKSGDVARNQNLVVIDEGHRITDLNNTLDELYNKGAKLVVILQDDHQLVRYDERGSVAAFRRYAKDRKIEFSPGEEDADTKRLLTLVDEKRCDMARMQGLGRLFFDEPIEKPESLQSLTVFGNLKDLKAWKEAHAEMGQCRYVMPFCWKPKRNGDDITLMDGGSSLNLNWIRMSAEEQGKDQALNIKSIQGLSLDYAAIAWMDDLRWDKKKRKWTGDPGKLADYAFDFTMDKAKRRWTMSADMKKGNSKNEERTVDLMDKYIIRIYYVLLTRAHKEVAVWFKDKDTKEHVLEVLGIEETGN